LTDLVAVANSSLQKRKCELDSHLDINACVAQLVEQDFCKIEAEGSTPFTGSKSQIRNNFLFFSCFVTFSYLLLYH
jgi:hypothetical protein